MPTAKIRLTPQVDFAIDDIFMGISELETPDLEQFLQKIARLIARRKSPSVSDRETILLKAINESMPLDLQNHYDALSKKLYDETITDTEHSELLEIIEHLEGKKVQRLEHLIELSLLRDISLNTLMDNLNLTFHA